MLRNAKLLRKINKTGVRGLIANPVIAEKPEEIFVDPKWFWHSCLHGHKDNVKRIIEKHPNSIDINAKQLLGFSALHLAIFGNHLPIVQILVSKFKAQLDFNLRNDDDLNPLGFAIKQDLPAIIRVLVRFGRPEISSLIHAIQENQPVIAQMLHKKLKKQFYATKVDILVPIER